MSLEGFVHFFSFGMVERSVGLTAADFYPFPFKNSFLQRVCLLRIVIQPVKVFIRLLPCSGVTGKWHLSGNSYVGLTKWREDNGAKMMSRSRQKFPRANKRGKTSQNDTPPLQLLDRCRFDPNRRFWAAFLFPGTRNKWMYNVICEQKIVCHAYHHPAHNIIVCVYVFLVSIWYAFQQSFWKKIETKSKRTLSSNIFKTDWA